MPTLKRYNVEALNRYPWPAVTATIQRCNDVTKNNVLLTIAQRTLEAVCQEADVHRFPDVSAGAKRHHSGLSFHEWTAREHDADAGGQRSEERRVGKECRSGWGWDDEIE